MTKGKYAVRTLNREAARDNELLRDKLEEIAALKLQIADLQAQLAQQQRDRDTIILREANTLSAQQIAIAKAQVEETIQSTTTQKRRVAEWLADYIHRMGEQNPQAKTIPDDIIDVIADLVGSDSVGEIMSKFLPNWNNRSYRRFSRDDIKANMSNRVQDAAFNGAEPEHVKFAMSRDAGIHFQGRRPPKLGETDDE